MAKYRKKPVVIDAIRFDLERFIADNSAYPMVVEGVDEFGIITPFIQTLEGKMHVSDGSYIIRGVNGEYYACKPDVFEKTYEKVTE